VTRVLRRWPRTGSRTAQSQHDEDDEEDEDDGADPDVHAPIDTRVERCVKRGVVGTRPPTRGLGVCATAQRPSAEDGGDDDLARPGPDERQVDRAAILDRRHLVRDLDRRDHRKTADVGTSPDANGPPMSGVSMAVHASMTGGS
jgi:hypothetical protein